MGPTNNLLRKIPTSPVVAGPPMFMKTIAVGPFEDVASWVTGGTTVAIDRPCLYECRDGGCCRCMAVKAAHLAEMGDEDAYFVSLVTGFRRAIGPDIEGMRIKSF